MGGVPELSLLLGEEFHLFFSFKSLIFSKEFQGVTLPKFEIFFEIEICDVL